MHRNTPSTPPVTNLINDKEFVNRFMEHMTLITKQTGVEFVIDTQKEGIAWMQPGNNKVFFNPVFTLKQIQNIAEKRAKEC